MVNDVLAELQTAIAKAHEALRRELSSLRAGRASAGLLDGVRVDYYGTPTPISQMASIAVPEARLLTVKPWDKAAIRLIEKAVLESGLGLNPQSDGEIIRLPLPPLTEDRRKELVKIAKKYGEECRVSIRKARHDAKGTLEDFKKEGEISEDDADRAQKQVDELTQAGTSTADEIVARKEKDILEV
jgi:ribosome recycling factor